MTAGGRTPSGPSIWLSAARPRTLPAALAPVLVGSAMAEHFGHFKGVPASLCLAFALLVQVGANFANDYFDFMKGADTPDRVGPRRAVAAGLVSPRTMRAVMAGTFAVAFLMGLCLIPWGGPWLILIGGVSILCGIAYTGGPWPLGYHGLGDLFVFLFFGIVAVNATYFVQAGHLSAEAAIASVPIGLLASNILVVNNYRDMETDARARKRTLVVRFGRTFAKAQYVLCLAAALLYPVFLFERGFKPLCLLPVLLAPLAWRDAAKLRPDSSASSLVALLGQTGRFLALYALLLSVGLAA